MSVKNNSQRIFILVIVAVFFLTALASSALALWDAFSNKDTASNSTDMQKQIEDAQKQQGNEQPKEGALKGTKLADFTPVPTVAQLEKIDIQVGTGKEAPEGATVTAHYTGALAKDGTIFESSKDSGQPATFPLSNVIQGWQQGVPGMKEGGKRRLIIPAALAYGERSPSPDIPANSDLVFDIELVTVQ